MLQYPYLNFSTKKGGGNQHEPEVQIEIDEQYH